MSREQDGFPTTPSGRDSFGSSASESSLAGRGNHPRSLNFEEFVFELADPIIDGVDECLQVVGESLLRYMRNPALLHSLPDDFASINAGAWVQILNREGLSDAGEAARLNLERLPVQIYDQILPIAEINPMQAQEFIQEHLRGSIYMLRLYTSFLEEFHETPRIRDVSFIAVLISWAYGRWCNEVARESAEQDLFETGSGDGEPGSTLVLVPAQESEPSSSSAPSTHGVLDADPPDVQTSPPRRVSPSRSFASFYTDPESGHPAPAPAPIHAPTPAPAPAPPGPPAPGPTPPIGPVRPPRVPYHVEEVPDNLSISSNTTATTYGSILLTGALALGEDRVGFEYRGLPGPDEESWWTFPLPAQELEEVQVEWLDGQSRASTSSRQSTDSQQTPDRPEGSRRRASSVSQTQRWDVGPAIHLVNDGHSVNPPTDLGGTLDQLLSPRSIASPARQALRSACQTVEHIRTFGRGLVRGIGALADSEERTLQLRPSDLDPDSDLPETNALAPRRPGGLSRLFRRLVRRQRGTQEEISTPSPPTPILPPAPRTPVPDFTRTPRGPLPLLWTEGLPAEFQTPAFWESQLRAAEQAGRSEGDSGRPLTREEQVDFLAAVVARAFNQDPTSDAGSQAPDTSEDGRQC